MAKRTVEELRRDLESLIQLKPGTAGALETLTDSAREVKRMSRELLAEVTRIKDRKPGRG
jgi:hypothetical protein